MTRLIKLQGTRTQGYQVLCGGVLNTDVLAQVCAHVPWSWPGTGTGSYQAGV